MTREQIQMLLKVRDGSVEYGPKWWPVIHPIAEMGYVSYETVRRAPPPQEGRQDRMKGYTVAVVSITDKGREWLGPLKNFA